MTEPTTAIRAIWPFATGPVLTRLAVVRVVLAVTGVGLLGLASWVARTQDAPTLRPFVVLVGVLGAFALGDGLAAGNATALSVVWLLAYLAIPTTFAWFVVEYYGLPHLASRWRALAFASPAIAAAAGGTVLILEPSTAGAMAGGGRTAAPSTIPAPILWAARLAEQVGLYYAGGTMLAGTALLVRTTGAYDHLDARLGAVLSVVPAWPWVAYLLTPAFVGVYPVVWLIAGTATGYVFSAAAATFAVTRGGLFDAAPAAGTLGPESVLANLDDVVVVVDRDGRVVRANDAALDAFQPADGEVSGTPLSALLGVDLAQVRASETVELETGQGTRTFEGSVTDVEDRHGRSPGRAVVLRDVTRQRVRAQRLEVLNRVLRHNLRNEMSAIVGQAKVIRADDGGHDEVAESILAAADELVDLGDRAQQVERMMSFDVAADARTDLAVVAREVVEPYRREYPSAAISVDMEGSVPVAVDGRVLQQVLDNLVDNALAHNDAPTPVVTVSARTDSDGTVMLSVSDNGPGLPEQERSVLESGEESPLEHGSGLGLWAVAWGATRMGASLSFEVNEPRGTVVSLELPRADAPVEEARSAVEAD